MSPRVFPLAALGRALTALWRPSAARYTSISPRPARSVFVVRDSTTRLYWCDPYLLTSRGDPRREWRARRYSWYFPTRAAALSRVEDVGPESRLEVLEVEPPPPMSRLVATALEFALELGSRILVLCNYCTVQLLHCASIGRPSNICSPRLPLAVARCLRFARTT